MSAQKEYKAPLELDPSKFIDCTLENFESNVGVVFVKKEKEFKVDTSVEADEEADYEEPLFGARTLLSLHDESGKVDESHGAIVFHDDTDRSAEKDGAPPAYAPPAREDRQRGAPLCDTTNQSVATMSADELLAAAKAAKAAEKAQAKAAAQDARKLAMSDKRDAATTKKTAVVAKPAPEDLARIETIFEKREVRSQRHEHSLVSVS